MKSQCAYLYLQAVTADMHKVVPTNSPVTVQALQCSLIIFGHGTQLTPLSLLWFVARCCWETGASHPNTERMWTII